MSLDELSLAELTVLREEILADQRRYNLSANASLLLDDDLEEYARVVKVWSVVGPAAYALAKDNLLERFEASLGERAPAYMELLSNEYEDRGVADAEAREEASRG